MQLDRDTLGPYLRNVRERRRITLDDITARTKISRSLLAKLERGDLTDWPPGIFRRSFFREYAAAIGLDPETLIGDFLRAFPDPADGEAVPHECAELRLTLDAPPLGTRIARGGVHRAFVDTLAIAFASALLSIAFGHVAAVVATVALLYHAIATVLGGSIADVPGLVRAPAPGADASPRALPEARRSEAPRRTAREAGAVQNLAALTK